MANNRSTSKIGVDLKAPKPVAEFLVFAQDVHDKIAAASKELPSPSPTLSVLQSDIDTLKAKELVVKTRAPGAVADRDAAFKVVKIDLNNERAYVEAVVNANPALAATLVPAVGMSLRTAPARTKAPLAAKAGTTSGVVHLTAQKALGASGAPSVSPSSAPSAPASTIPSVAPTPPTRCQSIEAHLEERIRDAFTKANADALKAVEEHRDPLSKRLALVREAQDKARAANQASEVARLGAEIAKLEERRSRAHPARRDASLMGLTDLRRGNVCQEGKDAAWALCLSNIEVVPTDSADWDEPVGWVIHAERVVARLADDGESLTAVRALVTDAAKDATILGTALPPRDLDGDGASEWFLHVDNHAAADTYRVITFRDGATRLYAHKPPADINGIVASGDALSFYHRDLLGAYKPCFHGGGAEEDVWGPRLSIDVLPDGSFSMTSDGARAENKDFCPQMPEHLLSPDDVVCAKMLGASPATLVTRIRKDNKPVDCNGPATDEDPRHPNEQLKFLLAATKLAVPYTK